VHDIVSMLHTQLSNMITEAPRCGQDALLTTKRSGGGGCGEEEEGNFESSSLP